MRDPKIFKELSEGLAPIRRAKTPEEKKAAVEEYKKSYAVQLPYLIDPDHPDLGPKNNQVVFGWGRMKGGRSDFSAGRFFGDALGTVNRHGHTTVCQGSLYFSGKAMSEQYDEGSWRGGAKFYWQTELEGSAFVLFVGANLLDANLRSPQPGGPADPEYYFRKNQNRRDTPVLQISVQGLEVPADQPRRGRGSRPGDDAVDPEKQALQRRLPGKRQPGAAKAANEPTWCNAVWLVKIRDEKPENFLRASEIGLASKEVRKNKDGKRIRF